MSHEKKVQVVKARCSEELYDAVCELADEKEREVSWIVRKALEEYLERHENVASVGPGG